VTVTVELADLVVSAALVTVIVCCPVVVGAVYSPVVEMIPTVAFPPVTPSTAHVTAVFEDPVTVAWNCCVAPAWMAALTGVTATEIVCVAETVALADLVVSAALVAVIVCCPAVVGAV